DPFNPQLAQRPLSRGGSQRDHLRQSGPALSRRPGRDGRGPLRPGADGTIARRFEQSMTTLTALSVRHRLTARRRRRGNALFIVVMVITLLTAVGLFGMRSASLSNQAAGYNR